MKRFILFLSVAMVIISASGCLRSGRLPKNEGKNTPQAMERYLNPSSDLHDTLLLYKKTPCFGSCPVFTMTVMMDGTVYLMGKKNMTLLGDYTSEWNADLLNELDHKMAQLQFYQLPRVFDQTQVTDLPSTYIGYTNGNHVQTIKCRYQTPQGLKDLAIWLDQEIEKTKWNLINSNNNHE
ncbi:MAG: hypothetical protein FJX95_05725 [Bacteroidetes bacterium]|nr:hypothetical protein [Bacteroidota bacterium]